MPFELLRKSAFYVAVMYLILEFLILAYRKARHSYNLQNYILFHNFKVFGIKASRSKIIKSSIMIMVRMNESPSICKCVPEGRDMVVQRKISIASDAQPIVITQYVCELLGLL